MLTHPAGDSDAEKRRLHDLDLRLRPGLNARELPEFERAKRRGYVVDAARVRVCLRDAWSRWCHATGQPFVVQRPYSRGHVALWMDLFGRATHLPPPAMDELFAWMQTECPNWRGRIGSVLSDCRRIPVERADETARRWVEAGRSALPLAGAAPAHAHLRES